MKTQSYLVISMGMILSLVLFQNCGDGFQSGSSSNGSQNSQTGGTFADWNYVTPDGDPLPPESCVDHTVAISCPAGTSAPQATLANGCPQFACDVSVPTQNSCTIPQNIESLLTDIYFKWFSRAPDSSGLCYHYGLFEVHQNIIRSEVDILMAMQEADASVVRANESLRRAAIDFAALNSNSLPSQILSARERTVLGIYLQWFERAPMAAGLVYWAESNFQGLELQHVLVSSATDDRGDRTHINTHKNALFRNFCTANGFTIPDWLN